MNLNIANCQLGITPARAPWFFDTWNVRYDACLDMVRNCQDLTYPRSAASFKRPRFMARRAKNHSQGLQVMS